MTRLRHLLVAGVAGALLVTLLPPPVQAQGLDDARRRVAELEQRITREERAANNLAEQLRTMSAEVGAEQGTLSEIRINLEQTTNRLAEEKRLLEERRELLRDRARDVYKRGPVQIIGVLLGAETIGEFMGRVSYARRVAERDSAIVLEAQRKEAELREIQAHQEQLERQQASAVESLRRRQSAITDAFARQQATLANLARDRGAALELLSQLEAQLGSELDGLRRVAGRGMPITYGEWADSFLRTLGAPTSRNNMVVVVAWQAAEGTQATWNPLATTMNAPGATVFNSHGVKNYNSKEQGIDASIRTLRLPNRGYEPILDGLERGAEPMETGHAINRSRWCAGCAGGQYVIGIIPAVEQYYDRYASR